MCNVIKNVKSKKLSLSNPITKTRGSICPQMYMVPEDATKNTISCYGKLSYSVGFDNYLRCLSHGQSCGSQKYDTVQKKKYNDSGIMNYHMKKPSFSGLQC